MVKEEYDKIPVHYCEKCLSLNIKVLNDKRIHTIIDYCVDCGNTDIGKCSIHEWEEKRDSTSGNK